MCDVCYNDKSMHRTRARQCYLDLLPLSLLPTPLVRARRYYNSFFLPLYKVVFSLPQWHSSLSLSCVRRHYRNNSLPLSLSLSDLRFDRLSSQKTVQRKKGKKVLSPVQRQPVLVCRQRVVLDRAPYPPLLLSYPPSTARSVEGQKIPTADQAFSFFPRPLSPSSCYRRPVEGLNSPDFCLSLRGRKKSDTVLFFGLINGTASELSFPRTDRFSSL